MRKWFFLDASVMAKRYIREKGTPLVNSLFVQVPATNLVCLMLGTLEVISIFHRARNAGRLSATAYAHALNDFRADILDASAVTKITAEDELVSRAISLVQKHSLNATDAVILRAALDFALTLRVGGEDVILVASDYRLLRAAHAEGLLTFDPETQTQADLEALIST